MNTTKIILYIPMIIWMCVIFLFSAQNSANSSETSSLPATVLAQIINSDFDQLNETEQADLIDKCQFAVRKLAHFSIYTVLGFLSLLAFSNKKLNIKVKLLLSAIICLTYAISDEIHQYFVPGRSCQLRDIFIDFCGSLFGIFLFFIIICIIQKHKQNKEYYKRSRE